MSDDHFEVAMYSLLGIGVLLDIFCYKYRKLAAIIFFYECAHLLLLSFVSFDHGLDSAFVTFASLMVYIGTLGCHAGICTVAATMFYFIIEFMIPKFRDEEDAKYHYLIYHKILYLMSLLVSSSLCFLAINWVLNLVENLKKLEMGPRALIDQMSEGCLLYSFDKNKLIFCNSMAQKFLLQKNDKKKESGERAFDEEAVIRSHQP